ncbi:hypothetical protein KHQ81_11465 [Mycoplasmatota bacterium]|nr:hypothetical protein KHQ81_11465 [Mycoplasmatota bacterium]
MEVYLLNLLFILISLFPNLLILFFPPKDISVQPLSKKEKILELLEKVGQMGIFIIPIFYPVSYNLYLIIGLICCAVIYYIGWIRFFINDRKYSYLFASLCFIPIPLAISPIVYFLLLSLLTESYLLMIFTLLFSIGHIPISYKNINRR